MKTTAALRHMLKSGNPIVAPGAYDGLSAKLVDRAGFPAVYASGGAIARSNGIPDLGLLSVSDIVARLQTMVEAVSIPLIADADTGYGNALNAQRAIRDFERVGVAGLHLEDQQFPKRCGHYENKAIVSTKEMQQKLRAARDAASDPDLVIIARTDGLAVEGFERTIERSHAYMEAGADVIFVEAPTSVEQIEEIARALPYPKLINMFHGGKTPLIPSDRLAELGYNIVIIPSDTQRAAIAAMERVLAEIKKNGDSGALADQMVSFKEREAIIGTDDYMTLDARYAI